MVVTNKISIFGVLFRSCYGSTEMVAAVKQYAFYVIEDSCSAKVLVDFLNGISLALITNDK